MCVSVCVLVCVQVCVRHLEEGEGGPVELLHERRPLLGLSELVIGELHQLSRFLQNQQLINLTHGRTHTHRTRNTHTPHHHTHTPPRSTNSTACCCNNPNTQQQPHTHTHTHHKHTHTHQPPKKASAECHPPPVRLLVGNGGVRRELVFSPSASTRSSKRTK